MIPYATQIANQSYPGYSGEKRLEPFSDDQRSTFGQVNAFADQGGNPGYYQYANQQAQAYGAAPAGQVNTGRVVDESGPLGKISDYMNPYVNQVVQPQIRNLNEAAARQRIQSGEAATAGGAFGDARHGVADSLTNREQMNSIADVTGRGYSDAYNQAMAARTGDVGRMFQADTQNQALREQALQRQLQSGQSSMDFGLANNADYLQRLNAKMNVGNMQQQQGQKLRDYDYMNYQQGVEWPFRQFDTLKSLLTGQPNAGQTQQQTTGGNSGVWNILGSALGAYLGGG